MNAWKIKKFKSDTALNAWVERNRQRCQIQLIFVNNGHAVTYRRLVEPKVPHSVFRSDAELFGRGTR